MYLPLVLVILCIVAAAGMVLRRVVANPAYRRRLAAALVGLTVLPLGVATIRRNTVYRDEVTVWRDALAKRPNSIRAHYNLAWSLLQSGSLQEAERWYQETLRRRPHDAKAYHGLAKIAALQGDLDLAAAYNLRALELDPFVKETHYNLGWVRAQQGRFEEAARDFEGALRIDPAFDQAAEQLRWVRTGRALPSGPASAD